MWIQMIEELERAGLYGDELDTFQKLYADVRAEEEKERELRERNGGANATAASGSGNLKLGGLAHGIISRLLTTLKLMNDVRLSFSPDVITFIWIYSILNYSILSDMMMFEFILGSMWRMTSQSLSSGINWRTKNTDEHDMRLCISCINSHPVFWLTQRREYYKICTSAMSPRCKEFQCFQMKGNHRLSNGYSTLSNFKDMMMSMLLACT